MSNIEQEYDEQFIRCTYPAHPIVKVNGVWRWKADPMIVALFNCGTLDLNKLHLTGYTKKDEEYKKLYRDLGYSLSGYWEVFYWYVNN